MKQVKSVQMDLKATTSLQPSSECKACFKHVHVAHLWQMTQMYSSWGGVKQVCQKFVQLRIQKTPGCSVCSEGALALYTATWNVDPSVVA